MHGFTSMSSADQEHGHFNNDKEKATIKEATTYTNKLSNV